jgi:uncharacterized protein YkwD
VRPRFVTLGVVLTLACIGIGGGLAPAGAAPGNCTPLPSWGTGLTSVEQQVITLVNQHRTAMGLNALVPASSLVASAEWKSMNMAGYQYLAHDDPAPVARSVADRIAACGYPTYAAWGENIAYGYVDAQSVMNAWLSDSGHKANIENTSWTTVGVGVAQASNGVIYWTQDFGTTGASIAPPPNDTAPPSVPSGLAASAAGQTSVNFAWMPSTDDTGVGGYDVYLNAGLIGSTGATSGTIGGLTCGTTYTLGVDAYDASGNHSSIATTAVTTASCSAGSGGSSAGGGGGIGGSGGGGQGGSATPAPAAPGSPTPTGSGSPTPTGATQSSVVPSPPPPSDATAPSVPGGLAGGAVSRIAVGLVWAPSNDDVGVTGYDVLLDGNPVTTTGGGSWTLTGLACGTSYTLGVDAFDAAGNHSAVATTSATTRACASRRDSRRPSAPGGVSASAAKTAIRIAWKTEGGNVAVAGYGIYLNGTRLRSIGPSSRTARFAGLVCGSRYSVGVAAYDGAGNLSPVVTVGAVTGRCNARK